MAEEKSASTTSSSVSSGLFSRSSKPPSAPASTNSSIDPEKESLNSNNNNTDSTHRSLTPSYESSSTGHEERFPKVYHAQNAEFVAELEPSLNYMDDLDPA